MTVRYIARTFKRSDYFPHIHHKTSEILYITNGTGRVKSGEVITDVGVGDIIFCPKHFEHTGPGGNCGLIYITAEISVPEDMRQHFIIKDDDKRTFGNFFETAYDIYSRPDNDIAYKSVEKSLCELIFDLAFNVKRQSSQDKEVYALCNAIERGFSDTYFQLGKEMQGISQSVTYLRRKFTRAVGVSPVKYLNQIRISHAKKLIAKRTQNYISMAEIAYLCGFSDERYFSRVFKQYCGITPYEYYKQLD